MEKTWLAVLGLLTAFEIGRWRLLYGRLAFSGQAARERERLAPISIIICARNEAANLSKNVPFILEQDFPDFEIVVVDDASTDGSAAILARLSKEYPRLRPVFLSKKTSPGKKAALTEGIRQARHENLLLTDADCRPASRHWARAMAACFSDEKAVVLGFSPYRREAGLLNKWIRFEACWTALNYLSFALAGQPYMGVGRNLAYRKSLFEKTGGFAKHADLASGDDDLFIAEAATGANVAVCLAPDAFVFSDGKRTCREYFNQKARHFSTGKRYPSVSKMWLGVGSMSHALHYLLVVGMLLTKTSMVVASMCFVLRMSAVWFVWAKALRRFGEGDIRPIVPFFDALIIPFHAVFSPVIFFRFNKSGSWTS